MSRFLPRIGEDLTVVLPSETMRARITRVVDADTVIVEIGQPFMKTHNYRRGDLVACRRTPGVLGETWQAIEVRPSLPNFPPADAVVPVAQPQANASKQDARPAKTEKNPLKPHKATHRAKSAKDKADALDGRAVQTTP